MSQHSELLAEPSLLARLRTVEAQIGGTPLHLVRRLFQKKNVALYAKLEWRQLSGSVKARAAFNIVREAIHRGQLHPDKTLLDATSGNTGIAYAAICRELGLSVALCLPENASPARKKILNELGAQIILTSKFEGTDGAQEAAKELAAAYPDRYYYADQYRNDANWQAHYRGTALEILRDAPQATHFVAGLGTTGTFTGTGRRLKAEKPDIKLTALQPDFALHGLEGWKHLETALVPAIYDSKLADSTEEISTAEAYELIVSAWKYEGLQLSPSAAANLAGAIRVAERLESGTVVTVLADNADKYEEVVKQLQLI